MTSGHLCANKIYQDMISVSRFDSHIDVNRVGSEYRKTANLFETLVQ
jgi:hypothetical protein